MQVDSTAIAAIDYDAAQRLLEVRFVSGGTYRYRDVEPDVAQDFEAADSKGRFFQAHILDRYAFDRLR